MLKYEVIPVTGFAQNCTLLWDSETKEAVLIDAGGEASKLIQHLQDKNLKLVGLWITHGHVDHVGAVGELSRRFNVPVQGPHPDDHFWISMLSEQSRMFGGEPPSPVQVSHWLKHGESTRLGDYKFEVRHAPGHTPGHVVFYSPDLKTLWSGDVLFNGSIGRTDFPQGDRQQLLNSIRQQLFTLPDETTVVSGHGPTTSIGHEKKTNPFLV